MKVKIGDTYYDSSVQPIMIIFDDFDIDNICNMPEGATKYCSFPSDSEVSIDDIKEWMNQ